MSFTPFLKWAGGKRWLVKLKSEIFDLNFNKYVEPFVGSAAIFFHLLPNKSILSDKNKSLIDLYRAIKIDWKKVQKELIVHSRNHSFDYYYFLRSKNYNDPFSKAAQFLYLNRTCWNGIYRVNKQGIFNVPKGSKDKVLLDTDDFEMVSEYLKNSTLLDGDFADTIEMADKGDLLFIDPPYTANHNNNGFVKYNEKIFSWDDQVRLSGCVIKAKDKGVRIILTNADHESVRRLYENDFKVESISRASILSGKAEFRRQVSELFVTNLV